ncbi:MAG: GEVED domain-containing protein, partial [Verrucomicrobiota bacterium]
ESSEQIASNLAMGVGLNLLSFDLPCNSPTGITYARFRLSSAGSLSTTGGAVNGEVEDYQLTIVKDAIPPTLLTMPIDVTVECDGSGNLADINTYLTTLGGTSVPSESVDFGSGTSVFPYTQSGFTLEEDVGGTAQQVIEEILAPAGDAELQQLSLNGAGSSSNSVMITNNLNQFFDLLTLDVEALDLAPLGPTVGVARIISSAGGQVQVDSTGTLDFDNPATVADTNAWNNLTWVQLVFNDNGNGLPSVTYDNLVLQPKSGLSASDNCSLALSVTNNYSSLASACGATGSTNILFTVTDECGNAVSATGTFTIIDTTRPSIVCPTDTTVECDGSGNAGDINTWLVSLGGSDVCGSVTLSNSYTSLSNDCGATGTDLVTFWVTDACGNTTSCTARFTIEDTTRPTITCPSNLTVECDGDGNTNALNTWLASHGGGDVCGSVSLSNDFSALAGTCG